MNDKDIEPTTQSDLERRLMDTEQKLQGSRQGRQQLVSKLKKSRREYLTIFDSVPAMIWYHDRKGRVLKANQCAADSVGMALRELVGKNYYELFPDDAERARQQNLEVMETGQPLRGQLRQFTAYNGLKRWVLVDRIPLRDEDGRIAGVMVFAMDITDKKKAEEELCEAKTQLEHTNRRLKATAEQARLLAEKATRSNRAKSELLASSSHDLRTPMNSIIGFAEILMETKLDAEQREYAKTIHQAGTGLLMLINDILDYSRIEAGKLKIEMVACDAASVVEDVRAMMETSARKKNLTFIVDIDEHLSKAFYTDPVRLRQCLVNLVGNAIKFTEKGHVAVRVRPEECAGQPCIRFDVEDTGIGVPPEKHETIFGSFSQADETTGHKYGGSGLGLTITRRLAGLLGGNVRLCSRPGTGSTFSLILPMFVHKEDGDGVQLGACTPRRALETGDVSAGRILLVENAFPSQLTQTLMLRRFGLEVELTASLEQMHQRVATQRIDVVFIDAAMGTDDLSHAVEKLHSIVPDMPVVLIADPEDGNARSCCRDGIVNVLYRPLTRNDLYSVIIRHLPDKPDDQDVAGANTDAIASVEALLGRLPELAEGMREVAMQSDKELMERFAELFCEIGRVVGQEDLTQKADAVLRFTRQDDAPVQQLTAMVDQLCGLCDRIAAGQTVAASH